MAKLAGAYFYHSQDLNSRSSFVSFLDSPRSSLRGTKLLTTWANRCYFEKLNLKEKNSQTIHINVQFATQN